MMYPKLLEISDYKYVQQSGGAREINKPTKNRQKSAQIKLTIDNV